jgi:hypothetical protein
VEGEGEGGGGGGWVVEFPPPSFGGSGKGGRGDYLLLGWNGIGWAGSGMEWVLTINRIVVVTLLILLLLLMFLIFWRQHFNEIVKQH